jgi:hypothetical protein
MRTGCALLLLVSLPACGTRASHLISTTDAGRDCIAACHKSRYDCYHSCSYGLAGLGCRRHCDDDDNRCVEGCPDVRRPN